MERSLNHQIKVRFLSHASLVSSSFDLDLGDIRFDWEPSDGLRARVSSGPSGYSIRISKDFPHGLERLFKELLEDNDVMYWLDSANDRDIAARLLADIAMEFVLFHEIGHVLGGHCDFLRAHDAGTEINELSLVKRKSIIDLAMSQSWEYEADVIACGLIERYATSLIELSRREADDHHLRTLLGAPSIAVEQAISLCIIALYCLFRELGETRIELALDDEHPDPIVRAFVCRDAIVSTMQDRHEIRQDLLEKILDQRFAEFDTAMETRGTHSRLTLTNDGIAKINDALSDLVDQWRNHRQAMDDYRYVEWPQKSPK